VSERERAWLDWWNLPGLRDLPGVSRICF